MKLFDDFDISQVLSFTEEDLQAVCSSVQPPANAQDIYGKYSENIDRFLRPKKGLGQLKNMVLRYAAACDLQATVKTPISMIFCADHGVAAESVSAYPPETTLHMTTNYVISKGGAANAFSNFVHSPLVVVDMGINGDAENLPEIIHCKLAKGTQNSAQGPAMSRQQAVQSLACGIILAQKAKAAGYTIMLPGEMGISNTTASAAITAAICNLPAEKTTGRGTNISDERLVRKIATVKKILEVNQPDATDALDVLAKVGGFELGAIAGLIIGAASQQAITVLDGFNTGAAALIASTLCPQVKDYLLASHIGGELGHPHVLKRLGLTPIMNLDIKLGEAIGSTLAADLLIKTIYACRNLTSSDIDKFNLEQKMNWLTMPQEDVKLTDKTFDFYTNTMPPLDKEAMEKCQYRIDNLAKPIYCLGAMEKIAVQLSGILGDQLPPVDTSKALLLIGTDKFSKDNVLQEATQRFLATAPADLNEDAQAYNIDQSALFLSYAMTSDTAVYLAHIYQGHTQMSAFDFGRREGEKLALTHDVLGLGMIDSRMELVEEIAQALLTPAGELRYEPANFLGQLNEYQQLMVSVALGAMVAAAHNRTMIVLDDAATVAVARYAVKLLPDLQDFLLAVQPNLYQMDITSPGVAALAGINLVTASLHVLNDMKTFAEAQVAVANDGPGKGIQVK